jgi:hypothetical protein
VSIAALAAHANGARRIFVVERERADRTKAADEA